MRVSTDWRSASRESYTDFCRRHPIINLTFDQWKAIIYEFNESFKEYILETGDKVKFGFGFGEWSINKKKRKKVIVVDGQEHIALPIDWKKTKEKGKVIYNFNFHTEGYFFGWVWFKPSAAIWGPVKEWIADEKGPRCTKFELISEHKPRRRENKYQPCLFPIP